MTHEIFISMENTLLRVAQVEDGQLVELTADPMGQQTGSNDNEQRLTGQIYLGQVERVVPRLQAAFVDIGMDRAGFLGAREARALVPEANRETPIEDCVQDGDTVLVQIIRPPQDDKGAQITADVTLPGSAVVLAPCRNRVAVSRSIEDEGERTRLAQLVEDIRAGKNGTRVDVEGMDGAAGWVIRTAAIGFDAAALASDMRAVAHSWELLIGRSENREPPCLLHEDLGPVERALRDLVRTDTARVVVEGEAAYRIATSFARDQLPERADRVEASEAGEVLFDRHDVAQQLETALNSRVSLPSGGWLMFETTEAMTTVDVNSGAHEGDALAVNLEAARVIASQIRLRALGGLIAIDFIDMAQAQDDEAVRAALDEGFQSDKNGVRIGPMSAFGVVEMTRRRAPMSLAQALRQQG